MENHSVSLWTIFKNYLRIGFQGWGGPVAQIEIIHEHAVVTQKWMNSEQFKDAYAICTMLPGPEAAELCMYIGTVKRGKWGGLVAGLGFMLPNFILITFFAWLYFAFAVQSSVLSILLFGVKPTMVAIVGYSLYRLSYKFGVWTKPQLWIVTLIMCIVSLFAFLDSLLSLILLGVLYVLFNQVRRNLYAVHVALPLFGLGIKASLPWQLVGLFFKIGALSFGGAYTVLAILQVEAVDQYGWLTTQQYLDGLAINELIPGPLIMVAAFVGYAAYGFWGAGLATFFIFLPAFLLVLWGMPYFERLRKVSWIPVFLTGVGAAVVGLTASFLIRLSMDVFQDWLSPLLAIGSLFLLWKVKLPIWLVFLIGLSVGTISGLLGIVQ